MQGIVTRNNRYKLIIDKLAYNPISTLLSVFSTISQFSQTHKPTLAACLLC